MTVLLTAQPIAPDFGAHLPAAAPTPTPTRAAVVVSPAPVGALRVKHAVDRLLALVALLVLLPLLLLLVLAVAVTSPGPVLFRQRRVGRDGERFDILKFRTMRIGGDTAFAPAAGSAPGGVEGTDRRTPIGRIMRGTSLDELPQLLNVLRGEMSLVGPRPERPEFVELFADEVPGYVDRHVVRVGMTGLAQVRGLRGQTSIADRAAADLEYIRTWSWALDLSIILRTFRAAVATAS